MKIQKTISSFQATALSTKDQSSIKGGFTSQEEEVVLAVTDQISFDLGTLDLL